MSGNRQRRLTPSEIDEIVRLREDKHVSAAIIARRFGLSQGGVNYTLLKHGVDPWNADKHPARQKQKGAFSAAEDARMLALGGDGMNVTRIAATIGRPYTSVRIRMLTLYVRGEAKERPAA